MMHAPQSGMPTPDAAQASAQASAARVQAATQPVLSLCGTTTGLSTNLANAAIGFWRGRRTAIRQPNRDAVGSQMDTLSVSGEMLDERGQRLAIETAADINGSFGKIDGAVQDHATAAEPRTELHHSFAAAVLSDPDGLVQGSLVVGGECHLLGEDTTGKIPARGNREGDGRVIDNARRNPRLIGTTAFQRDLDLGHRKLLG